MPPKRTAPFRVARAAAALAGALLVTTAGPRPARADLIDRVVAVVDEEAIFQSDLERRARPLLREIERSVPDPEEQARRRDDAVHSTLQDMINESLFRRAAARAHLPAVTEGDVDHMIEAVAARNGGTPDQLYAALAQEGVTRQEYRNILESQILRLRVVNARVRSRINVTQSDIEEEYRRQVREAGLMAPFHAAYVFVSVPDNPSPQQVAAAQRRAEEVTARAREGADFGQLARQYSDDADTRANGGDLGTLDPRDPDTPAPPWMLNALRELAPGQVSGSVRGEHGFYVFKLFERQGVQVPPLAAVRDRIFSALFDREAQRQQDAYLRELRSRSSIDVRLDRPAAGH